MTRWLPVLALALACDPSSSPADSDSASDCSVELCDGLDNDCDGEVPELRRYDDRDYLVCHLPADALSWEGARAGCEAAGMQLVVIDDAAEAAFLKETWDAVRGAAASIPNDMGNDETLAWIGLSDQSGEGDWRWVDASDAPTDGWCPNEPNDFDGEDCAAMGWTADYGGEPECPDGGWNDLGCEALLGYFCEAP